MDGQGSGWKERCSEINNILFPPRPECQRQVTGFTGAKFKKFPTRQQAETFIRENSGSISSSSSDSASNSSVDSQPVCPPTQSVRVLVSIMGVIGKGV